MEFKIAPKGPLESEVFRFAVVRPARKATVNLVEAMDREVASVMLASVAREFFAKPSVAAGPDQVIKDLPLYKTGAKIQEALMENSTANITLGLLHDYETAVESLKQLKSKLGAVDAALNKVDVAVAAAGKLRGDKRSDAMRNVREANAVFVALVKEVVSNLEFNKECQQLYKQWLVSGFSDLTAETPGASSKEVDSSLLVAATLRHIAARPEIIWTASGVEARLNAPRKRSQDFAVVVQELRSQERRKSWSVPSGKKELAPDAANRKAVKPEEGAAKKTSPMVENIKANIKKYNTIHKAQETVWQLMVTEHEKAPIAKQTTLAGKPGLLKKAAWAFFGQPSRKTTVPQKGMNINGEAVAQVLKDNNLFSDEVKVAGKSMADILKTNEFHVQGFLNELEQEECQTVRILQRTPLEVMEYVFEGMAICEGLSALDATPQQRLLKALNTLPYRVLGFQDLIRATERLIDNDAREIAHIENKAGGEERERIHVRTETNEVTETTEDEEEREESRDLSTSSQFTLQSETQRQLQRELSADVGVKMSASYGTVKVDVATDFHASVSETQSQRDATTYAKSVMDKTLTSLRRRVRRQSVNKTSVTVEERNRHLFRSGPEEVSLIYLWVEKIKEITLRQYGKRMLLEFIIPEPGAYLAYKYLQQGSNSKAPLEFKFIADEITEFNYLFLANQYNAVGITPPPPEYLTVSGAEKTTTKENEIVPSIRIELKIPPGYMPYQLFTSGISVVYGGGYWRKHHIDTLSFGMDFTQYDASSRGSYDVSVNAIVPIAVQAEVDSVSNSVFVSVSSRLMDADGGGHLAINGNVTLRCKRSCRKLTEWQIATHERISAAYTTAVERYEERLRQNPTDSLADGHPLHNRQVEREEMKRYAISILNKKPVKFDLFPDWGNEDQSQPPEIPDLGMIPELREELDRFEESLEWQQSTYKFYPRFWGGASQVLKKPTFKVSDPQHQMFLEAGAVRLIVPVVPGRERALLTWLLDSNKRLFDRFASLFGDPEALTIEDIWRDIVGELPNLPATDPEWVRLLVDTNEELVRGTSTLLVTNGSSGVTVNDVRFPFSILDLGREIWIGASNYKIAAVTDEGMTIQLDGNYGGVDDNSAVYVIGSQAVGSPWTVRVPTSMVVLEKFKDDVHIT